MSIPFASILTASAGLGIFLLWKTSETNPARRSTIQRIYSATLLPHVFRTSVAVGPVWAAWLAALSVTLALPTDAMLVPFLATLNGACVALFLAYRQPKALLPRWLRQGIATGDLQPAVPSNSDWTYLWLITGFTVFGTVAFGVSRLFNI